MTSKNTAQIWQRERRLLRRNARRDALAKLTLADISRPAEAVVPEFTAALGAWLLDNEMKWKRDTIVGFTTATGSLSMFGLLDYAQTYGMMKLYCELSDGIIRTSTGMCSMLSVEEDANVMLEWVYVMIELYKARK